MQIFNSCQDVTPTQCSLPVLNVGVDVPAKYAPYMDIPDVRERVERMQVLKKQFQEARDVMRSLGGDARSDNPLLNEP
jgi:hypothetical protein